MEEYKGKKIEPKEIENITLDNSPHYFIEGKYIGFCNSDGLPHGLGELIAPPTDAKLNKERNIIEVTKRNDHNKTPWSCNGEWEDGVFVKGSYNMPPFSRHQGEFIFNNGDWKLIGALTSQQPSGVFRTNFISDEALIRSQSVTLGISVEPLETINNMNQVRVIATNPVGHWSAPY